MEDTLFHKGDLVYLTKGKFAYMDAEVISLMHTVGSGVCYTVLIKNIVGKGKNKHEEKYVLGGVIGPHMRKR